MHSYFLDYAYLRRRQELISNFATVDFDCCDSYADSNTRYVLRMSVNNIKSASTTLAVNSAGSTTFFCR